MLIYSFQEAFSLGLYHAYGYSNKLKNVVYMFPKVFLSQNLQLLAASLIEEIEKKAGLGNFQKQWIIVPSHSLKQWLMIHLARFSRLGGIAGCKIGTFQEMILFRFKKIPNPIEMRCLIYDALNTNQWPEANAFLEGSGRGQWELISQLAELFFSYGEHGLSQDLLLENWQGKLFHEIFHGKAFRLPIHFLLQESVDMQDPIYCFGFHYMPEIYWEFLKKFPFFQAYCFSPCVHFWEDTATKREQQSLSRYWKKQGASWKGLEQAESYFSEAPPLLSSWGKLGRETLAILNKQGLESELLHIEIPPKTVLHRLQMEILLFERQSFAEMPSDDSIEIFLTGASKLREVEVLQEEICLLVKERGFSFADILVLAPEIEPYVPLIEYVFSKTAIPYRFPCIQLSQSPILQGLLRLVALAKGDWSGEKMVSLFECGAFLGSQKVEPKERDQWIEWIYEIFRHSEDWEKGFALLMQKALCLYPGPKADRTQLGDFDLLEKLFLLLQSLHSDLMDLHKKSLTLAVWAEVWEGIAAKYLRLNEEDEGDASSLAAFHRCMGRLRLSDLQDGLYPFEIIEDFLTSSPTGSIHGNHLHAVSCESLKEGSVVPAKAIFMIGMDEENFPRKIVGSSLNLLKKEPKYLPDASDMGRYLFLQALMSASEILRISYGHLSQDEGKPIGPSLLVRELVSCLGSCVKQTSIEKQIPSPSIPPCFSLVCPKEEPLSGSSCISLSDLASFAKHPWRYYLQKVLRIYLEDRSDLSFAAQKSILLRSCVKWPLDAVFSSLHETLPRLFDEAFYLDVKNQQQERDKLWEAWNQKPLSLSFLATASNQKRLPHGSYEFPPLKIELDGGSSCLLVGEMAFALEDGVVHFGDDSLSSVLKIWPEALAACIALKSSKIYFLKTGKIKTIQDPEGALKHFIQYFLRCKCHLTPLLPDWADRLLRKGFDGFSYEFAYENVVNRWIFERLDLPDPKELFDNWGWLKHSFAGLIDLYPARSKKGVHETV